MALIALEYQLPQNTIFWRIYKEGKDDGGIGDDDSTGLQDVVDNEEDEDSDETSNGDLCENTIIACHFSERLYKICLQNMLQQE